MLNLAGWSAWRSAGPRKERNARHLDLTALPGPQETWVDYDQDRAPLLFTAGEEDHIMPPSVNKSNARHYKNSPALTEYVEFEAETTGPARLPVGRPSRTTRSSGPQACAYNLSDLTARRTTGPAAT